VTAMPPSTVASSAGPVRERDLEAAIQEHGNQLFTLMEAGERPSLFSKQGLYGTLMDWAMRDDHFKTQLFRFVDVLPTLTSPAEITRHLQEYLGDDQLKLSPALRARLKAAGGASRLFGAGVKAQVSWHGAAASSEKLLHGTG
jgi:RHH-type transcriptional regulator, proline utilization regulon repressor / proline dehydrogenase / delta 1-pyrroline-5-carboxylate dehydrogenase